MCDFPARELIVEMRRVCREADKSQDMTKVHGAADYVLKTQNLRLLHEEATGCKCWYQALRNFESKGEQ